MKENHMKESMIMLPTMIWVILIKKNLLDQSLEIKKDLILAAAEPEDLPLAPVEFIFFLTFFVGAMLNFSRIGLNSIYLMKPATCIFWCNKLDPTTESRIEKPHPVYVPRDETFEEIKQDTFSAGRLKAVLHNLIPTISATLSSSDIPFKCFSEIDKLYIDGVSLIDEENKGIVDSLLVGKVMKQVLSSGERLLKYEIPAIVKGMLPLRLYVCFQDYFLSNHVIKTCFGSAVTKIDLNVKVN
jgi:hypothetical protein